MLSPTPICRREDWEAGIGEKDGADLFANKPSYLTAALGSR